VRFRSAANLSASSSTRGPLDDHHPKSAENLSRRRWHRPSILIIGSTLDSYFSRNYALRLHHYQPGFRSPHHHQGFQVRSSRFVEEIQHPIIREALKLTGVAGPYLESVSLRDIPAGTGMGSAESLTTALLCALHTLKRDFVLALELGRARLSHRSKIAQRAHRQTGSVHRRLWRLHPVFSSCRMIVSSWNP
jgi:hypothetical protein